jgi:hypothetical protein
VTEGIGGGGGRLAAGVVAAGRVGVVGKELLDGAKLRVGSRGSGTVEGV